MRVQPLMLADNTGTRLKAVRVKGISRNGELSRILNDRKLFCIARDSNLDGISGASLLMHEYGLNSKNVIFTNYSNFKDLLNTLKKLRIKDSAVVFNDLAISSINFRESKEVIGMLKRSGNFIIWLDHHPWEKHISDHVTKRVDFSMFGESRDYCASELVYLLLCKRDRTNRKVAMLAHYSDFVVRSKYDQLLFELSYSIVQASFKGKRKQQLLAGISKAISRLDFRDKTIKGLYSEYMNEERSNIKALLAHSHAIKAGEYTIGLAFGKRIQTNSACAAIRDAFHSDMEMYVNIETGKCGIRSRDYIDGSAMAKKLGGGGHPQASGFNVNAKLFREKGKAAQKGFVSKTSALALRLYV